MTLKKTFLTTAAVLTTAVATFGQSLAKMKELYLVKSDTSETIKVRSKHHYTLATMTLRDNPETPCKEGQEPGTLSFVKDYDFDGVPVDSGYFSFAETYAFGGSGYDGIFAQRPQFVDQPPYVEWNMIDERGIPVLRHPKTAPTCFEKRTDIDFRYPRYDMFDPNDPDNDAKRQSFYWTGGGIGAGQELCKNIPNSKSAWFQETALSITPDQGVHFKGKMLVFEDNRLPDPQKVTGAGEFAGNAIFLSNNLFTGKWNDWESNGTLDWQPGFKGGCLVPAK